MYVLKILSMLVFPLIRITVFYYL